MPIGYVHVSMEGYENLRTAGEKKIKLFRKGKTAYFVYSMMAGIYVGLCMILIMVIGGLVGHVPGLKVLQGASFAAALSFVVFAGAELYTGNVFVMTTGLMQHTVIPKIAFGLVWFCWLGNLAGSILIAALFMGTGQLQGPILEMVNYTVSAKTDPSFMALFARGILCNLLVCLAVWCCYRMNSESGKLIMIFWCIYLFVVCGFEHSIANMTLFSMEVMAGVSGERFVRILLNLIATTLGNYVGGAALAFAYWPIAKGLTSSTEAHDDHK